MLFEFLKEKNAQSFYIYYQIHLSILPLYRQRAHSQTSLNV